MRSATSKTSTRLCETSTTASPCSARRLTRSSTCRVCATPSAAVGSSRKTTRLFHITARATATDCRCPPESVATGWRTERIVVTASDSSVSVVRCSIAASLQPEQPVVRLAAEVHVLDDVEVVAEREILVDDLDPELGRVLRAVDRDPLAVEEDLAAVDRVDAGDALDQRRLAGAVVADERHDLAVAHLEVDVVERLHRAEVLRDAAQLERRGGGGAHARFLPRLRARPAARPHRETASYCSTSCTRRRRPGSSSGSLP